MTEMKTSEVLDTAADLIEKRGWTQGGHGWDDTGAGLCLEGGIAAAFGIAKPTYHYDAFRSCPAYRAVQEYLGHMLGLYVWNDRTSRTQEEVIGVLRAASAVEATKEAGQSSGGTLDPEAAKEEEMALA